MKFLLFLDFDGVMHPLGGPSFKHRKKFEALLRLYPDVRVVFSTSWRFGFEYDTARMASEHFSPDLHDRFIGCNPYLQEKWPPYIKHERYKECIAFMEGIQYTGPWLALDDADEMFPKEHENLLLCKSWLGLDGYAMTKLKAILDKHLTQEIP